MQYLVLGSNGMAGHMIAQYLTEQGHQVTGFARQEGTVCKTIVGDAMDHDQVRKALQSADYDYVINAVGVLNRRVDAKLADGIYLNSVLPHFIADELQDRRAKLIHISSDCVFEGTKGHYTEQDIPDAHSYYGRTKALGEVYDNKNLSIRTSIVGPELKKDGIGLFHWFMSQKEEVGGFTKVIWSGVTTLQLARVIATDAMLNQTGLYHLVNNEIITKYDLLQLFNKYCRKNPVTIIENSDLQNDKSLVNSRVTNGFEVPSYEKMVKDMAKWIEEHPDLYGQYEGV
jgi:dTDP-4-dehydrorhamnose reductase